ncbi:FadR/GntR family transcriptional regulator [Pikeienuella sp. HZG-20]|uniref:FadR/GntR family transcriptional regulator n=1 Tax=Paludibacillus litoralis TaxID=3133267 RepID=UPI0030EDD51F
MREIRFDESAAPQGALAVRNHLMALIRGPDLPQDGRLPTERELVGRLGASRRAVRRAIAALESEGLVWRRQGKGTFAGQPRDPMGALAAEIGGEATMLEVMEARACIEPELAALAAQRAAPEEIARMRRLSRRHIEAADPEALELWDGALHRLIAQAARNRPLMIACAMLDEIRASADWMALRIRARSEASLRDTGAQHSGIIDAIAAGDAAAARETMGAHLRMHRRAMLNASQGGNG